MISSSSLSLSSVADQHEESDEAIGGEYAKDAGRTGDGGEFWKAGLKERRGEPAGLPKDERKLELLSVDAPPMRRVRLDAKSITSCEVFSRDSEN